MSIFSFSIFSRSSSLSQIPNLALRFSSSLSLQNLNFSRANPHFGDSSMEGLLGQKLNRHEFSLISASKLPFSKESGEATAAVQFVVESGTTQLKFHYEVELSNVVVRVDLRSAQVFELGPVESICVDEGSDGGENEKKSFSTAISIRFKSKDDGRAFCAALEHWKKKGSSLKASRTGAPLSETIFWSD